MNNKERIESLKNAIAFLEEHPCLLERKEQQDLLSTLNHCIMLINLDVNTRTGLIKKHHLKSI